MGGVAADAVVHVGMHGTVEWLPGSPLGGTATSWPDKLLGGAPNVCLYAALGLGLGLGLGLPNRVRVT